MMAMAKRALILGCFSLILTLETGYFARQGVAGILRLLGDAAFYANDQPTSWRRYRQAVRWGGDPERLEVDMVEMLLFGLAQQETGVKILTAVPPERAVPIARRLIVRRLRDTPYRADYWSLASDLYRSEARERRQKTPIDLAALGEDPLENLLPEDWLGIAAREVSSRLEPNNYLYPDLLAETFLEAGSPSAAAKYCRLSVAAFPDLDAHSYLWAPDLAPDLLEAAIGGFEDARSSDSMISMVQIETDAGRLLVHHRQYRRALPYLERAVRLVPDDYDAQMELGLAKHRLNDFQGAIERLEQASRILPQQPWPHYFLGLSRTGLGDIDGSITEFRKAKVNGARTTDLFRALGEALEKAGQSAEAAREFKAAANLNPGDADAWSALLAFSVRHPEAGAASEACARLLALRPQDRGYSDICASLRKE